MILTEQIRLIKASGHVHTKWYHSSYPEVAKLGITPAEHYLRLGAAMGRNPGKDFNTKFYLEQYPDAAESELNPLVHYMLHGKSKGYAIRPQSLLGAQQVNSARTKLLSLGFTERPLQELVELQTMGDTPETRALAARELALWHLRTRSAAGYRKALGYLTAARPDAPDLDFRRKLAVTELLCHHLLADREAALVSFESAALAGEMTPDLILASANLDATPEERLTRMNRVLSQYGIPPIALLDDDSLPAYDRLTSAVPLPSVTEGPKVTVLIAAYEAERTLPTALRSLQEQTWQNLEILVLDDCSPSPGTGQVAQNFADSDPRVRLIRMTENLGAYVARNHGLDEATGEYVTLHDADDWSHPLKIETQVRHLINHQHQVGCLSEQARTFDDLTFTRLAGHGALLIPNTSSFMFNKTKMKESVGYWDTVRFSADNELIRRLRNVHGKDAVQQLVTGPLSFQRDSSTSIIADAVMGINGFFFGARKEYLEAQTYFRKANSPRLTYGRSSEPRPFPAPVLMLPDRKRIAEKQRRLDTVIAADFRGDDASVADVLEEIRNLSHTKLGVFEMNRYDAPFAQNVPSQMSSTSRAAIWASNARILTFGEEVACGQLVLWGPDLLQEEQRYLPVICPDELIIVLTDAVLASLVRCTSIAEIFSLAERRAKAIFGCSPQWRADQQRSRDFLETVKLPIYGRHSSTRVETILDDALPRAPTPALAASSSATVSVPGAMTRSVSQGADL